jgi:hypothetical protein
MSRSHCNDDAAGDVRCCDILVIVVVAAIAAVNVVDAIILRRETTSAQ